MTKITIPKFDPVFNTVIALGGTTTDYLLTNPVKDFVSTAFTIEFWMLANTNSTGTILSYTLTGEKSLVITNPSNINIYINNIQVAATNVSFVNTTTEIDEWHYFTLSWENTTGTLLLYKDGVLVYSSILAAMTTIQPGGSLVIGQLQGSPGGNMSSSFKGKLTQFRVWNNVRPAYNVEQDMNRNIYGDGMLVPWQLSSLDAEVNQIAGGWFMQNNTLQSILLAVVPQPYDGETYLIRSLNNGLTWEDPKPKPNNLYYNIAVQQQSNTVWASLNNSSYNTYNSYDGGTTWTNTYPASMMSINSAVPNLMVGIGTDSSLWAMVNGAPFAQLNADYKYSWVSALMPSVIYAVTTTNQLVFSTSGGKAGSFAPVANFTNPVKMVQTYNNIVAVLTLAGEVYISVDQRVTWKKLITDSMLDIAFINVINYELWAVTTSNLAFRTSVNMEMVINWQLNEGYGCFGFDYSGNDNNAYIYGCTTYNDEEAWEISTIIRSPQFIESNTDLIPYISSHVRKQLYLEEKAEAMGPIIGEGLMEKIAEEASVRARKVTRSRGTTTSRKATAAPKKAAAAPKKAAAKAAAKPAKKAATRSSSKKK
ncbi:concanavalin A-like lectin/glucanase superfamily protein [Chitinophaga skermanii]|uniref:Concanavalin A-like lectin/glucanase superfamily protein n=1 Tax=Chitinophaga skermanii TaxID=331697 RepID=A0A327QK65_9BACT|nr:LamG-like jellyroll fold domain-containing protein [Chitinophaga skermanii]RAJ05026.1 concanavalin A-like lectin/glucanase superfamily protein [Chitinophaga skermanii]